MLIFYSLVYYLLIKMPRFQVRDQQPRDGCRQQRHHEDQQPGPAVLRFNQHQEGKHTS